MKCVIDTAILIDHLRGIEPAVHLLTSLVSESHELWSVTPVRTEILAGMRLHEKTATLRLLSSLQWQAVTQELADEAGELASRYLRSHPGVDTVDYLVAATTQLLNAQLYTMNVKHFPMFENLKPAYRYRKT